MPQGWRGRVVREGAGPPEGTRWGAQLISLKQEALSCMNFWLLGPLVKIKQVKVEMERK